MDAKLDKEYAGITGLADFTKTAAILAYGKDSAPVKEGRVRLPLVPVPDVVKSLTATHS